MQKLSAGKFHFEPPSLVPLFDHPIGYREQAGRERDTERLGGVEIDDKFKLGRLHDRQVRRLSVFEDATGVDAELTIRARNVGSP